MLRFFNNLLTGSLLASLAFLVLGLAFIFSPAESLMIISNVIAGLLIAYGAYGLILSFQSISISYSLNIGTSIISLVMGIIILCNNGILEGLIPVILGLFFIINGVIKLRYSLMLKQQKKHWLMAMIVAVVLLVLGILMMVRPIPSAEFLTTFVGVVMVIYAICDLIDVAFLKRDLATIEAQMNKHGRHGHKIREAEIVDKKHKK